MITTEGKYHKEERSAQEHLEVGEGKKGER
jgi:hypothetical protein